MIATGSYGYMPFALCVFAYPVISSRVAALPFSASAHNYYPSLFTVIVPMTFLQTTGYTSWDSYNYGPFFFYPSVCPIMCALMLQCLQVMFTMRPVTWFYPMNALSEWVVPYYASRFRGALLIPPRPYPLPVLSHEGVPVLPTLFFAMPASFRLSGGVPYSRDQYPSRSTGRDSRQGF